MPDLYHQQYFWHHTFVFAPQPPESAGRLLEVSLAKSQLSVGASDHPSAQCRDAKCISGACGFREVHFFWNLRTSNLRSLAPKESKVRHTSKTNVLTRLCGFRTTGTPTKAQGSEDSSLVLGACKSCGCLPCSLTSDQKL